MKQFLFTVLFFTVSFGTHASEQLVVMQDLGNARHDYTVIGQIDDFYFILADDHELQRIHLQQQTCTILDNNPRENLYLFVWTAKSNESLVSRYGTVLGYFSGCFLLRTTEQNVIHLNNHLFELSRLSFTPLKWSRPYHYQKVPLDDTINPLIEKMVDEVSEDSIRSYIRKLQSFETRYSSSEVNKNEVCPWIYEEFKRHTCDSVYLQELNDEFGPNIIGIKRGKKDSSYTTYCILGGHVDDAPSIGRAPGADDNASGAAIMLEVARVTKKYAFNHTIQFQGWNAEETGMKGSDVSAHIADSGNHVIIGGVLNFDMVGCTEHGPNVEILYNKDVEGCEDFVHNTMKPIIDRYTDLNYVLLNNTTTPTDHISFWNKGFIAIGGVENNYHDNITYHQSFDTLDHPQGLNNTKHVTEVAKAALALLATFAVPYPDSPIQTDPESLLFSKPTVTFLKGKISITIHHSSENESMRLRVCDLSGRLVKTVSPVKNRSGGHTFIWTGHNEEGYRVRPGLYILHLLSDAHHFVDKVILIPQ